ncbi:HK97 family phage prohead protease [Granulicella tundricola]|uniref:Phage prohead protease, HK97 family n=1 Tax=Granulicella tundricola (strain ATCC BAA-1859 / DSM 23138 / MP5ACTX9) TaxID=1198114 RepID=E8X0Q5_GRATM|nr:HK97 family phage prohead protease [Granulicella tundricola]ADW69006.1 phage prohead protease, HK97 family [Granulicella tundricola MP5ACTX9]
MQPKSPLEAMEVRTAPLKEVRVETNATGGHTVSGYAIVFNSESVDLGGFIEVVAPTALNRTLTGNPDVLCLRDHKQEFLLGRTTAGTLNLAPDDTGLHFTCNLPNTTVANDLAESLRRGDIDSCSFGFSVVSDAWTTDGNGNDRRTLLDLDLFEISIVSFPAYESTSASLRTAPPEVRARVAKRTADEGADDDNVCPCTCPECLSGTCNNCSVDGCSLDQCSCDNDERSRTLHQKRSLLALRLLEMQITL